MRGHALALVVIEQLAEGDGHRPIILLVAQAIDVPVQELQFCSVGGNSGIRSMHFASACCVQMTSNVMFFKLSKEHIFAVGE